MTDEKLYRAGRKRSRDNGVIQLDKLDLKEIRRDIGRLFRIKPGELKFRNFFVLNLPIQQRSTATPCLANDSKIRSNAPKPTLEVTGKHANS